MVATWVYGALINICGSIAINFGTNVLKFAHNRNDERQRLQKRAKNNLRSRTWLFGFTIFTMGNLANFLSFGFAAQSLLAGLGSVQFITNVVFAHCVLGELITRRILLATICIVAGNSLVVAFANQSSEVYSGRQLLALYARQAFVIYAIVLVGLVLALQIVYKRLKQSRYHPHISRHTRKRLLPLLYAGVSAIIGTQSVILAKSASTLLRVTLKGNNQLFDPFTYAVLAAWVVTMVFWLYRMNAALRKFDGVFIIPTLQVVWILFSVLGGGIYFQEFAGLRAGDAFFFACGLGLVMFGVYLLAPRDGSGKGPSAEPSSTVVLAEDESVDRVERTASDETTGSMSSDDLRLQHNQPRLGHESLLSLFAHDVMFGPFELANEWRTYDHDLEDDDDDVESPRQVPSPPSTSHMSMHEMCRVGDAANGVVGPQPLQKGDNAFEQPSPLIQIQTERSSNAADVELPEKETGEQPDDDGEDTDLGDERGEDLDPPPVSRRRRRNT